MGEINRVFFDLEGFLRIKQGIYLTYNGPKKLNFVYHSLLHITPFSTISNSMYSWPCVFRTAKVLRPALDFSKTRDQLQNDSVSSASLFVSSKLVDSNS